MGVSSYSEFVTVLFGWVMYDRLWAVLNDTGLVYLPFLVVLLRHVIESRKGGDDEGAAAVQSLKKLETDVVVMLIVLVVAVIPSVDVTLGEMDYTRPRLDCAVEAAIDDGTEPATVDAVTAEATTGYGTSLASLGGEVGRIPVWWGLVHWVSKAVVAAGVAGVPCSSDISGLVAGLARVRPEGDGAGLAVEIEDFRQDCHQVLMECARQQRVPCHIRGPEWTLTHDWMGGSYWFNPGLYDSVFSSKNRESDGWVADPGGRDAGRQGAHPSCQEWWLEPSLGLRAKMIAAIPDDIKDRLVYSAEALLAQPPNEALSVAERETLMLRKFLGVRHGQQAMSYDVPLAEKVAAEDTWFGKGVAFIGGLAKNVASSGAAMFGAVTRMPGHVAAGVAIREGLPVFLSLLLMVFVVCLPVLQLIGRYDVGMLMTLTVVFFALQFCYVLWAVAFWVDNHFTTALTGSDIGAWKANPVQSYVILWLQRLMYVVFPIIWISALTWVGINVGDAFTQAVSGPMQQTASVAEKAADQASQQAQGAAGRGIR